METQNNCKSKTDQMQTDYQQIDLLGKLCPYAVFTIIDSVEHMPAGQTKEFMVDDPLAIKSVPEELEVWNTEINIEKIKRGWLIRITKN